MAENREHGPRRCRRIRRISKHDAPVDDAIQHEHLEGSRGKHEAGDNLRQTEPPARASKCWGILGLMHSSCF